MFRNSVLSMKEAMKSYDISGIESASDASTVRGADLPSKALRHDTNMATSCSLLACPASSLQSGGHCTLYTVHCNCTVYSVKRL